MPNHYTVVYHLDVFGRIPPGQLAHAEDHDGGWMDVYLHPAHVAPEFVRELNRVLRHHIGSGLWQQYRTDDGQAQEPAQGLDIAQSRWELVDTLPAGRHLLVLDEDKLSVVYIRRSSCTEEFIEAKNEMLRHLAGDGLWRQYWDQRGYQSGPVKAPPSLVTPPRLPVLV
ncbi:hypothetical protein ABZT17_42505 [Streptomyces sp. NPDC005648]|uniref:hypothetical protein n=1 Tax=Streptomyces sp. NPDC005648 TaxID=3157044 RepID=UPI0033AEB306